MLWKSLMILYKTMKKTGLALLVLTTPYNFSFANPLLTRSKYLISVQSEAANGAVRTGPASYPLIYDSELATKLLKMLING